MAALSLQHKGCQLHHTTVVNPRISVRMFIIKIHIILVVWRTVWRAGNLKCIWIKDLVFSPGGNRLGHFVKVLITSIEKLHNRLAGTACFVKPNALGDNFINYLGQGSATCRVNWKRVGCYYGPRTVSAWIGPTMGTQRRNLALVHALLDHAK